jgi:Ca2+-transporting ATPase
MEQSPIHTLTSDETLTLLNSREQGLNFVEVQDRLNSFGRNRLAEEKKVSAVVIFGRQFANLLIVILLIAAALTFWLKDVVDGIVILAIVNLSAVMGFVQEYRAERAAAALRRLAAPAAVVVREGQEVTVPVDEVVPGDILQLAAGDRVAADGRLLAAIDLKADEALLTGESHPVEKKTEAYSRSKPSIADQRNMVFGGTVITSGKGRAVVTATGMDTEFGHIARMIGEVKPEKTPLERRLVTVGRVIALIALVAGVGIATLKYYRGYEWLRIMVWVISLAVATVPESLPTVLTGSLAIGTTRMARRKAIVKRLPAVETMGALTVICTDKTGTLTKNEMTVRRLRVDGLDLEVTGLGYEPVGIFKQGQQEFPAQASPVVSLCAKVGLLCNDASLEPGEDGWRMRGDPTEGALVVLGLKAGLDPGKVAADHPRVEEIPFSSESQLMTTLHRTEEGILVCVKGAPESLLPRCTQVASADGERLLSEADRGAIEAQGQAYAAAALRLLGLAYRRLSEIPDDLSEGVGDDLVWVGLAALMDPPRPEAREAIAQCRRAGIRVIMITGDHKDTALAVAREIGLVGPGPQSNTVIQGGDLKRLSDAELMKALPVVNVFARVAPEHKLRLVNLLKELGEVVAMTGDGVNDAPALKRADIGVAMGITGTEVTKETAAMILLDDNFATLVGAVEEGRAIYDNIKKYLMFLMSCNLALILVLSGTFALKLPLALLALQILWINIIIDGPPALALGVDPKSPDLMSRPPRPVKEGLFNSAVLAVITASTLYLTIALLGIFAYYIHGNVILAADPQDLEVRARTLLFVSTMLSMMALALNCRSDHLSLFTVGFFRNRYLVLALLLSLGLAVTVIEWPSLARHFGTVPLGYKDWLLAAGVSLGLFPVLELTKLFIRWRWHTVSREP